MGYHYDWTNRSYPPPPPPPQLSSPPTLIDTSSSSSSSERSNHPRSPELMQHYSPMPRELQRMATYFTDVTRCYFEELKNTDHEYQQSVSQSNNSSYHATACIVNYYNTKSVMGIHRDEIELALHQPVISISIGCAGIFLFGGTSLDVDVHDNGSATDRDCADGDVNEQHPHCTPPSQPIIPILLRSGDVILFGGPNRLNYHSMPRIIPQSFLLHDDANPQFQQPQLHVDDVFEDSADIQHEPDYPNHTEKGFP